MRFSVYLFVLFCLASPVSAENLFFVGDDTAKGTFTFGCSSDTGAHVDLEGDLYYTYVNTSSLTATTVVQYNRISEIYEYKSANQQVRVYGPPKALSSPVTLMYTQQLSYNDFMRVYGGLLLWDEGSYQLPKDVYVWGAISELIDWGYVSADPKAAECKTRFNGFEHLFERGNLGDDLTFHVSPGWDGESGLQYGNIMELSAFEYLGSSSDSPDISLRISLPLLEPLF